MTVTIMKTAPGRYTVQNDAHFWTGVKRSMLLGELAETAHHLHMNYDELGKLVAVLGAPPSMMASQCEAVGFTYKE